MHIKMLELEQIIPPFNAHFMFRIVADILWPLLISAHTAAISFTAL